MLENHGEYGYNREMSIMGVTVHTGSRMSRLNGYGWETWRADVGRQRVVIVGGGASGMVAAIAAARAGALVTILEQKEGLGKKILSTGNGRCNMTNLRMEESCYRGCQPGFAMGVIRQFPVRDTLAFFEGLGILTRERNGYVYPYSEQASAVLDGLLMEIRHLGIQVETGSLVRRIRRERAGGFEVEAGDRVFPGDAVVLAAGSKAAPVTGSDGSGYGLAAALGHRVIEPLPALVQLCCQGKIFKQVAGIRCEARVAVRVDGTVVAEDTGELQLTDYGLSGIPTFQVSRYASQALAGKKRVEAVVDFFPAWSGEALEVWMDARRKHFPDRLCGELFNGVLQRKLSGALLQVAGIALDRQVEKVPEGDWRRFARLGKAFVVPVTGTSPFEKAQVCCGGVDTREIQGDTMESRRVPGLYLAGELVDVDGICGGYNLQWAWSSGYVAGSHAGGRMQDVQKPVPGPRTGKGPKAVRKVRGSQGFAPDSQAGSRLPADRYGGRRR